MTKRIFTDNAQRATAAVSTLLTAADDLRDVVINADGEPITDRQPLTALIVAAKSLAEFSGFTDDDDYTDAYDLLSDEPPISDYTLNYGVGDSALLGSDDPLNRDDPLIAAADTLAIAARAMRDGDKFANAAKLGEAKARVAAAAINDGERRLGVNDIAVVRGALSDAANAARREGFNEVADLADKVRVYIAANTGGIKL